MELPYGVLVRSFRGPIPLAELNSALLKDSFTGLMRASLLKGTIVEGVIIYDTGKPVIAFTSDSRKDSPDNDQKANTSVAASDDTVIELFALNEGQLRLAMDFGRDFLIKLPPPPAKAVEAPRPIPVQRPKAEKPLSFPEVRGTFARSESAGSLRSYIEMRKDETGHAVIIGQDGAQEYHLLLLHGKVIAAYSASSKEAGAALLNNIMHVSGVVEFYRVDEAIVHSILRMYPHVGVSFEKPPEPLTSSLVTPMNEPARVAPWQAQALKLEERADAAARPAVQEALRATEKLGPMETHRYDTIPRQGIGVPAKSLFDRRDRSKVEGMGMPAPESKSTGTLKGDMDDDADFVKKVEKEFVGNVDDLLKRLELSHLKVVTDKKKRL